MKHREKKRRKGMLRVKRRDGKKMEGMLQGSVKGDDTRQEMRLWEMKKKGRRMLRVKRQEEKGRDAARLGKGR